MTVLADVIQALYNRRSSSQPDSDLFSVIGSFQQTSAETAAAVSISNFTYPPGDVRRYGADSTGSVASDTAWAQAISQASQTNGSEITFPGTYLINNGIVLSGNGIKMRGAGVNLSTIIAGQNNINLVKISGSYCRISDCTISADSKTGVHCLVLAPSNESATGVTSQQDFNTCEDIQLLNGLEGLRLRAGPTVSGTDSQVFYNSFRSIWIRDCVRSIWMQDTINVGNSSPNRNFFHGVRCGSTSTVCNTGIQVDVGTTNTFFGLAFEGITNGSSPNATPTAVLIKSLGANGVSNDSNRFFGATTEACTVALANSNVNSEFWGCSFISGTLTLTAIPLILLGGTDPSQVPQILPSLLYQSNSEVAGYRNLVENVTAANGLALVDATGQLGWITDSTTYRSKPAANTVQETVGGVTTWQMIAGATRNVPVTNGTGPGGSSTVQNFPFAYTPGGLFLIARGAYDSTGTNYSHRVSLWFETASGTFIEETTRMMDQQAAGVTVTTDTVTRSSGNLVVTVSISKSAIVFTNYASVIKLT